MAQTQKIRHSPFLPTDFSAGDRLCWDGCIHVLAVRHPDARDGWLRTLRNPARCDRTCLCCQTQPDPIDSCARTLAETSLWRVCPSLCILDVGLCTAASRHRVRWLRSSGTPAVVRHRLLDPGCSINSGD